MAPTFVASYLIPFDADATPRSVSVTVADGDLLIVSAQSADDPRVIGAPTGGAATWIAIPGATFVGATQQCNLYSYYATYTAPATFNVSMSTSGSGGTGWGARITRWADHDGVGGVGEAEGTTGAPSVDVTTTGADSALIVASGDWNTVSPVGRAWRTPSGGSAIVEMDAIQANSTHYTGYHATTGAPGVKTVGLSAPAGQRWRLVGVEVLSEPAASSTRPTQNPARMRASIF